MKSQFVEFTGLHQISNELCCGPIQNTIRSNFFCKKVAPPAKPSSDWVTFECLRCNVNCNSHTQLKQHINGHQHKAMYAGEDPLQRKSITGAKIEYGKWK